MHKTVFYMKHQSYGGKMVPYAGFEMPVEFDGVKKEHNHVREKVGLFDVSHMGEFFIKGDSATDQVQYLTSNDVNKLSVGKVQYSCFPNNDGGIIDDLLVYKLAEQEYLLVVNAANIQKDWDWVNRNNKYSASIVNESETISQLALQGPLAKSVLQKLTDLDLDDLPYYTFKYGRVGETEDVFLEKENLSLRFVEQAFYLIQLHKGFNGGEGVNICI